MSDACAVIEHAAQAACCEAEEETCWICLDGPKEDHPLVRPCSCPRTVHASCLAKWQLTSAGRK
jgi:E3 ubiquitin-protein ligase DOA10